MKEILSHSANLAKIIDFEWKPIEKAKQITVYLLSGIDKVVRFHGSEGDGFG